MHPSTGSAYLGASAAPFVIDADPNAPDFAVPDIVPPPALELARLESRRELLGQVDRFQRTAEAAANRDAQSVGAFRQKAFDLMTSRPPRRRSTSTPSPTSSATSTAATRSANRA